MTYRTPLIFAALLASLFAGCSKRPALGALTSSASIVIRPNVSIGGVRSGMTMRQVIAALGEPDAKENEMDNGEVLRYGNLGFSVLPAKGGLVGFVLCGSSSGGNKPPTKSFAGHTTEGIGIGSSRADVISAYGEPTVTETMHGDSETLKYKPLGLDFRISDGKVNLIAVFLSHDA